MVGIYNPRVPVVRWEVEAGESLEATYLAVFRDEQGVLSQGRWKVRTAYPYADTSHKDLIKSSRVGLLVGKRDGASF